MIFIFIRAGIYNLSFNNNDNGRNMWYQISRKFREMLNKFTQKVDIQNNANSSSPILV